MKANRPILIALGLLVAALMFNIIAARQCPLVYGLPEPSQHQTESGGHHPSASSSAFVDTEAAKEDGEKPSKNGCFRGPFGVPADGWVALFTMILTVATGLLWLVTRQTLDHAQESSARELRAYLHAIQANYAANTGTVEIMFKNFGQTPAHDVNFWIVAIVQNFDDPFPPFERSDQTVVTPKGSIGPTCDFVSAITFSGAAQQRVPPIRYYGKAFAFGKITYADAFGKEWDTEFYFAAPWPSAGEMGTHTSHNIAV